MLMLTGEPPTSVEQKRVRHTDVAGTGGPKGRVCAPATRAACIRAQADERLLRFDTNETREIQSRSSLWFITVEPMAKRKEKGGDG
jgi:hypothetical protein